METLTVLLLLTSLLCIAARPSDLTGAGNSTLIYPSDLPLPLNWTAEGFEDLENALESLKMAVGIKNITHDELQRVRRSVEDAEPDNSHFCCEQDPPAGTATRNIVRSRVLQKQIPRTTERSCSWFRTCTSTSYVVVHVIEYYLDTDIYEVPAAGHESGCPRDLITCCEGYLRIPPYLDDNCLTAEQMLAYIDVLEKLLELGLIQPVAQAPEEDSDDANFSVLE